MGGIRGGHDNDAFGGEGSDLGESSFHFPVSGDGWNSSHSGGVGLSLDSILESRCLGNRDLVGASVIETIGGSSDEGAAEGDVCGLGRSCDDDATGDDACGAILGKGGISHGRGMRSSEDGAVFLIGGSGISSGIGNLFHGAGIIGVASLCGGDGVSDWGSGMLVGLSMIIGSGSYCSIDEYSC